MTTVTAIVVVDVSLALKWVLIENDSGVALLLLAEWNAAGVQPVVPSWFACEAANVLLQYVRRGDLTVDDALDLHAALTDLVAVQGDEPADAARALALAHGFSQPRTHDT